MRLRLLCVDDFRGADEEEGRVAQAVGVRSAVRGGKERGRRTWLLVRDLFEHRGLQCTLCWIL